MNSPPTNPNPPSFLEGWAESLQGSRNVGSDLAARLRRWLRRRRRAILAFFYGVWPFLVLYAFLYLVAGTLFFFAEEPRYTWPQSLYFAVGAFAGVTFSDVYPTTPAARIITGFIVLLFVFLLALVVTGFGKRAQDVAREDALGMLGTEMKGHYVVIGTDAVAEVAARDLLRQRLKVAMLMERPEDVDRFRPLAPPEQLFLSYGPPAEEATLRRLNVPDCLAVIVSTHDDSLSVIVALLVRTQAPHTRIIVSATRPELRTTIRTAGVTFVASPLEMGGRICASAAFEPDVAEAIDELTTVTVGSDLEEFVLPANGRLVGRTFAEAVAEVYQETECILIGYCRRRPGEPPKPSLAPQRDERLQAGDAVILVVRAARTAMLRSWLGVEPGS